MGTMPIGEISADVLAEAHQLERIKELEYDGLRYLRFCDKHHGVPRGTAVLGQRVVPGYPSISRIFMLEAGVRENLHGPFYGEEKVDGYNVRVLRHEGANLALTRGGFVCPFTTDRLPDLGPFDALFAEHPDLVVCGEVAGPGNPYIGAAVPAVPEDIAFFAFDLMRINASGFVPLPRRDELLDSHGFGRAALVGQFEPAEIPRLRAAVLELDQRGIEGIVLKPFSDEYRVKYVTPGTNLSDIVVDIPLLAELPEEFFELRLLRLALGICEFDLHDRVPELERKLGHALISQFTALVDEVRKGGVVADRITLRVSSDDAADRVLKYLNRVSHKIQVRELGRRREDGYTIVELQKTYLGATSRIKTLAAGARVLD